MPDVFWGQVALRISETVVRSDRFCLFLGRPSGVASIALSGGCVSFAFG